MKQSIFLSLLFILTQFYSNAQCTTPLEGSYTIGAADADFNNFTEAIQQLSDCGVSGAVVFNVKDGTYTEQLIIPEIQGVSETNTVTFQSETQDSEAVILQYSSSNYSINYVIKMDGTDWLKWKFMTIAALSNNRSTILSLQNGASNNSFSHINFQGTANSYDPLVVASDYNQEYNHHTTFRNNQFIGGEIAIAWDGSWSSYTQGLVIEHNQFEQQQAAAINLSNVSQFSIKNNIISGSISGINLSNISGGFEVIGNKFFIDFGGNRVINGYDCHSSANSPGLIANNYIEQQAINYDAGLSFSYSNHLQIYHNTFRINSNAEPAVINFYDIENLSVKNNIFYQEGNAPLISYNDPWNPSSDNKNFNNNNYYTHSEIFAYWNDREIENFEEWKNASQLDFASHNLDPIFKSDSTYQITQTFLRNRGENLGLNFDIDGDSRSDNLPDIGADEFTPTGTDVGVFDIQLPAIPLAEGTHPMRLALINHGGDTLTAATIHLMAEDSLIYSTEWIGQLASSDTTHLAMTSPTFSSRKGTNLMAWATLPTGLSDNEPANDTTYLQQIFAGLQGTYTIGGNNPDFENFSRAAWALDNGGVNDSVTFNVRNGIYEEQIKLSSIPGLVANRSITFQSEQGDSSQVILKYNISNSTKDYVCLLENVSNIRFHQLGFEATSTDFYHLGRIFVLEGDVHHIHFTNNRFQGRVNSSSAIPTIYANPLSGSHYTIENNVFSHGDWAIMLNDEYRNSTINNIRISKNQMLEGSEGGIRLRNTEDVMINNNQLKGRQGNYSFDGIVVNVAANNLQIEKNIILMHTSGAGISLNGQHNSGEAPRVINNYIKTEEAENYLRGIYSNISNTILAFNTIHINGQSPNSAAFIQGYYDPIEVKNNIFANFAGGYAMKLDYSTDINSNHNNLFSNGSVLVEKGSTNYQSLEEWQSSSGQDMASFDYNPYFLTENTFQIGQSSLNAKGTPIDGVLEDLEGEPRDSLHPDIGADEFIPFTNDAGVVALTVPQKPFHLGKHPISVEVKNYGSEELTTLSLNWTVNGVEQKPVTWSGSVAFEQTTEVLLDSVDFKVGQGYHIEAWTSNPNDIADSIAVNDRMEVSDLYAGLAGVFTLGVNGEDFSNFATLATQLNLGGLTGATTIKIKPDTYFEQFVLGEIIGSDWDNTLTIEGEGEHNPILSYSGEYQNNYTIWLKGTDHVTFQNITFEATGSNYSRIVLLSEGANHNVFHNNHFFGAGSNSYDSPMVQVQSSYNSLSEYNTFTNNNFNGGSRGIHYDGDYNNLAKGVIIEANTFRFQQNAGVWLSYVDDPVINYNFVTPPLNSNSIDYGYAGIFLDDCKNVTQFRNNNIVDIKKGSGIGLNRTSGSASTPVVIANNFIHVEGEETATGIQVNGGNFITIIYNSINVTGNCPNCSAFNTVDGFYNSSVRLFNNILSNQAGGPAIIAQSNDLVQADYNNLYTDGNTLAIFDEVNFSDLQDWQSASFLDLHSLSVDPMFVSDKDLHVQNVELDKKAFPFSLVTTDFDGDLRDIETPDIGADEFIIDNVEEAQAVVDVWETLLVGPNPASEFVQLQVAFSENTKGQVLLFDNVGKPVWSTQFEGMEYNQQIDVSALPSGFYILQLTANQQQVARKIEIVR